MPRKFLKLPDGSLYEPEQVEEGKPKKPMPLWYWFLFGYFFLVFLLIRFMIGLFLGVLKS